MIVLSEHYVQSNWTKLEFQAARNLTKKDNIEVSIELRFTIIIIIIICINQLQQLIIAVTVESGRDHNRKIIGQSESEPG